MTTEGPGNFGGGPALAGPPPNSPPHENLNVRARERCRMLCICTPRTLELRSIPNPWTYRKSSITEPSRQQYRSLPKPAYLCTDSPTDLLLTHITDLRGESPIILYPLLAHPYPCDRSARIFSMENHFPGSEIGQRAILMNNTFGCCILKFERFNALPLLESCSGDESVLQLACASGNTFQQSAAFLSRIIGSTRR